MNDSLPSSPNPIRRVLDFLFKLPPPEKRNLRSPISFLRKDSFVEDSFNRNGVYVGYEFGFIMQMYCLALGCLAYALFITQQDLHLIYLSFLDVYLFDYSFKQRIVEHLYSFSRNVEPATYILFSYFIVRYFYNVKVKEMKIYFVKSEENFKKLRYRFRLHAVLSSLFLALMFSFGNSSASKLFVAIAAKIHILDSYFYALISWLIIVIFSGVSGFIFIVATSNISAVIFSFIYPGIITYTSNLEDLTKGQENG